MNFWKMLITFLPWLGYKIIMDVPLYDFTTMLSLAVIFAFIVCIWQTVTKRGKGILHWGTLAFFGVTLVLVVLFPNKWYLERLGVFSSAVLAVLVWLGILFRRPFTMVYAKEIAPPERWNAPDFVRRNYLISGLWGVTFVIQVGIGWLKAVDWDNRALYDVLDNVLLVIVTAITCMSSKKPQPIPEKSA